MTETLTRTPAPFSIDDWLTDASLPTASADVYKDGNALGKAQALKREIEQERAIDATERSAAEKGKLAKLEAEYVALLERWSASRITVYVTALTKERIREIREAHDEATKDYENQNVANELFGYDLLAEAIIGVAAAGHTYVDEDGNPLDFEPVTMRPNQVRGLERKIGTLQMQKVLAARQEAQNALPEMDADFLLDSSGRTEPNTPD